MNADAIVLCENLTKTFGSGHTEVRAVDHVSLDVKRGEIVLVMGPSGSGKTTLLSMIGALLRPNEGKIVIDGQSITSLPPARLPDVRARSIGFVFQAFNLLDALTVEENILLPSLRVPGAGAEAKGRARGLMDRLGLARRAASRPGTLSGGEKQRVAIARALINRPPLILADEPTGNLDSQKGQEVTMILHDIARDEGVSVMLVTHDPRLEDVADRILWLEDGKLRDRKTEQHDWIRDPVCGMRVDAWTATAVEEIQGQRFVFCTESCRQRFLANPASYPALAVE